MQTDNVKDQAKAKPNGKWATLQDTMPENNQEQKPTQQTAFVSSLAAAALQLLGANREKALNFARKHPVPIAMGGAVIGVLLVRRFFKTKEVK